MNCNTYVRGRRCQAPARVDSNHCIFHDPEYAEERVENARAGGQASRRGRAPDGPIESDYTYTGLSLSSGNGLIGALEFIAGLELTGRISPQRSRNILRAIEIVAHNIPRLKDFAGNPATYEDVQLYRARIDEVAPELIAEAQQNDAQEKERQATLKASSRPNHVPRPTSFNNSLLARALLDESAQHYEYTPKHGLREQIDPLPLLNQIIKQKKSRSP